MALKVRKDFYYIETGIITEEIYKTSKLLSSITGIPVQPNKAIVGANAFAHESGIHQDGVLKERSTYEIMKPLDIGLDENKIVLGKHSGRHALKDKFEKLGFVFEKKDLDKLFEKFKKLADKKKEIFDDDLILIANDYDKSEEEYTLSDFYVVSGINTLPEATILLDRSNGDCHENRSTGDGPIDASFNAINEIVKLDVKLMKYSVNAITEGIDAQATVAVQIKHGDNTFSGTGGDTDIIVASVKAYLNALNRALFFQKVDKNSL